MRTRSANKDAKTLETLIQLESCCENINDLLESYRYLQPDGKPFSASTIEKIARLQGLHEALAHHEQERDYHARMIKRYQYELHCIENGIEAQEPTVDENLGTEQF
jgi:hypothetical protein